MVFCHSDMLAKSILVYAQLDGIYPVTLLLEPMTYSNLEAMVFML